MSVAKISAVTSEVLTKSVLRCWLFHKTIELGVKLRPSTSSVKAGSPADMFGGLSCLMLGWGALICCWQQASNTASAQTNEPLMRRAMPRKFLTPESAGRIRRLSAIVETTRDGRNGQSGCLTHPQLTRRGASSEGRREGACFGGPG